MYQGLWRQWLCHVMWPDQTVSGDCSTPQWYFLLKSCYGAKSSRRRGREFHLALSVDTSLKTLFFCHRISPAYTLVSDSERVRHVFKSNQSFWFILSLHRGHFFITSLPKTTQRGPTYLQFCGWPTYHYRLFPLPLCSEEPSNRWWGRENLERV